VTEQELLVRVVPEEEWDLAIAQSVIKRFRKKHFVKELKKDNVEDVPTKKTPTQKEKS
jgi:hypothetical protein